jgi:hypothetical protein
VSTVTLRVVEPGTTDVARTQRQPSLDDESRAWLDDLRTDGKTRDEAIARLHALLFRAARFEIARRRVTMPHCAETSSTTSPPRQRTTR